MIGLVQGLRVRAVLNVAPHTTLRDAFDFEPVGRPLSAGYPDVYNTSVCYYALLDACPLRMR